MKYSIGDQIAGGYYVIIYYDSDYRVFVIRSQAASILDPTNPVTITFKAGEQVDDINAFLNSLPHP